MKNTPKTEDLSAFDARELIALARLDIEKSAFEPALRKIKQLVVDPNAPAEGFALAGRVYAQLGLLDRAKGLFEKYLALNPRAIDEMFQLGMVHFDTGQADDALKIWADVLQKQPTYPPALFYRALALAQRGNTAESLQSLDLLLKSAAPDNLYFGRAKELRQAIEARQAANPPVTTSAAPKASDKTKEGVHSVPKDPYKTEH